MHRQNHQEHRPTEYMPLSPIAGQRHKNYIILKSRQSIPGEDDDADNAEDNLKTNKHNFNWVENNVSTQYVCLPEKKIEETKQWCNGKNEWHHYCQNMFRKVALVTCIENNKQLIQANKFNFKKYWMQQSW